MISFSKSKTEEGKWNIVGRIDEVVEGETVVVNTKSGGTRYVLVEKILSKPFPSRNNPDEKLVFASYRYLCWWLREDDDDDRRVVGLLGDLEKGTVAVYMANGSWKEVTIDVRSIEMVTPHYGIAALIDDESSARLRVSAQDRNRILAILDG